MGWNDENDWLVGPEFQDWSYEVMPSVQPEINKVIANVREIFPNAQVFKDTHLYVNHQFANRIFCIGESEVLRSAEPILIIGDYQTARTRFRTRGKWSITVDDAWQSAWLYIQHSMLEKFEK